MREVTAVCLTQRLGLISLVHIPDPRKYIGIHSASGKNSVDSEAHFIQQAEAIVRTKNRFHRGPVRQQFPVPRKDLLRK